MALLDLHLAARVRVSDHPTKLRVRCLIKVHIDYLVQLTVVPCNNDFVLKLPPYLVLKLDFPS